MRAGGRTDSRTCLVRAKGLLDSSAPGVPRQGPAVGAPSSRRPKLVVTGVEAGAEDRVCEGDEGLQCNVFMLLDLAAASSPRAAPTTIAWRAKAPPPTASVIR